MSKLNFTKALIEALPPADAGKRTYIYDSKVRGLGVAVTDRGTKTYILYRWVRGKPERVTLGRFPDLSIEQARKLAEKANAAFAMGENPADTNRKVRGEMTLQELFDRFLELHAKVHKRSWEEDEAMFKRYLEGLRGTKISNIRTSDLQVLHAKLGEENGQATANRTRALLHAMFNKARLPASHFPGIRAAVDVSRETTYDGGDHDRERYMRRMIERVLTQYGDLGVVMEGDDLDYLLKKMGELPALSASAA